MSQSVEQPPKNFSWFVENKVAGMAWPAPETLQFLVDNGVRVLINLTQNNPPVYHEVATACGIECVHVDIQAYGIPTMEQVDDILSLISKENSAGRGVGIHCFMGQGRTGTILACYLVAVEGMSATDAITETRKRRKKSIETNEQEKTVHDYERHSRKL